MGKKECIAKNLAELRKVNNLTQNELAKKLNYSDKAISKWEHGEALPDIEVLLEICNLYNITLNDIVKEDISDIIDKEGKNIRINKTNQFIITFLSVSLVWFIATFIFLAIRFFTLKNNVINYYPIFLWAVPASSILLIIFNSIWGKKIYTFFIVSLLTWSLLTALYIQFIYYDSIFANLWPIFFLGIPMQIAIILWAGMKKKEDKLN